MPQYFFDVQDGIDVTDHVGRSLPDLGAARQHALQVAAAYAGKPEMIGENGGAIIVSVRTSDDGVVLAARLVFNVEVTERV